MNAFGLAVVLVFLVPTLTYGQQLSPSDASDEDDRDLCENVLIKRDGSRTFYPKGSSKKKHVNDFLEECLKKTFEQFPDFPQSRADQICSEYAIRGVKGGWYCGRIDDKIRSCGAAYFEDLGGEVGYQCPDRCKPDCEKQLKSRSDVRKGIKKQKERFKDELPGPPPPPPVIRKKRNAGLQDSGVLNSAFGEGDPSTLKGGSAVPPSYQFPIASDEGMVKSAAPSGKTFAASPEPFSYLVWNPGTAGSMSGKTVSPNGGFFVADTFGSGVSPQSSIPWNQITFVRF